MRRLFSILAMTAVLLIATDAARAQPARDEPAADEETEPDPELPPDAAAKTDEGGDDTEEAPSDPDDSERLRARAKRIRALMSGTLDIEIEPSSLFVIDLADPALVGPKGQRLRQLLRALETAPEPEPEPPRRSRRRASSPEPEEPVDAITELTNAWEAYLRLPLAERAAVLDAHAMRQQAAKSERETSANNKRRLEAVTLRADRLEAFLAGTLAVEIEPRDLLTLDLADAHESALSERRRDRWLPRADEDPDTAEQGGTADPDSDGGGEDKTDTGGTEDESADDPTAPANNDLDLDRALAEAEARLDGLRQRFVDQTPQQQSALFEAHERRVREAQQAQLDAQTKVETEAAEAAAIEAETEVTLGETAAREISEAEAEAEQAAADQAQALEAARQARTEAKRILAEERARLFSIKEAQARYSAEVNGRKSERIENHAVVIEWSRRVDELERSPLFGPEREAEADSLYASIRRDLSETRTRLSDTLRWSASAGNDVPGVGEGLDKELSDDIDRGEIVGLRAELRRNEKKLTALEKEVAWELAQGLRDDVVLLNSARLTLLDMASPELHSEVTGFGAAGIDQVKRELEQISLELRFHVLKLPRYGEVLKEKLSASPVEVLVGTIKFLLIGVMLTWWRRRSPEFIRSIRRRLVQEIPLPRRAAIALSALWYFAKIRRPLELLLALWLLFGLVGGLEEMPELALLWIIVRWLLIGQASILLLDALASRGARGAHQAADTSVLRIHSLRVAGLTVVAVGMLLSLASAMVGKGAIYSWVLSTCWVLSIPVLLYLVQRWRPTIKERLAALPEQGPASRWGRAQAQAEGNLGFFTAMVAAVYLLARGIGHWFLLRLGGFELTRRLLAYLFRREVAKLAATTSSAQYEPVDKACYGAFDPDQGEPNPLNDVVSSELQTVATLARQPRATFSAVVGERGLGKSTFLRLLKAELKEGSVEVVPCPEHGIHELMGNIAAIVGDNTLRDEALADALRAHGTKTIAIDDAQRLITPSVRGLRPLDELIAFARMVGGEVSWVITMDMAAWNYLQRARGDRVFFEHIVTLPRWTESQLGALIRQRCEAATIVPSFEALVVPRAEPIEGPDEGRSELGYYRLLWDFSRGNPAVAQHAFRESLFVDGPGATVVRLFEEPVAAEIEKLSPPLLFVLRAIVQLDLAREHEVVAATLLPAPDVSDALRFCLSRGYIEPFEEGLRLTWRWYRTITTVLQRQHLLSIS